MSCDLSCDQEQHDALALSLSAQPARVLVTGPMSARQTIEAFQKSGVQGMSLNLPAPAPLVKRCPIGACRRVISENKRACKTCFDALMLEAIARQPAPEESHV